ncbi:DUF2058 domain-containing protein [Thiolinea disciformis]|uniref:DUF2058 domain-containing protein n=1 Tax=Thiolinea disciformis TaxID=125614 RepID=UPI00036B7BA5|nr:DUF2058 domain-containing protein [Thiolinea disciformis]
MSLKDQLLKAGLIDKDKAAKAEQELRKKEHQKTAKAQKTAQRTGEVLVDEAKVLADKARQAQAERSRELNRVQREQAEQHAIQAQIRQLIDMNKINRAKGEISYQFADANKIKNIYVTDTLQDQLAHGMIALVRFGETYELVPKAVAEKIAQRDPSCVLVQNISSSPTTPEDDPYADYKIPDDLMW